MELVDIRDCPKNLDLRFCWRSAGRSRHQADGCLRRHEDSPDLLQRRGRLPILPPNIPTHSGSDRSLWMGHHASLSLRRNLYEHRFTHLLFQHLWRCDRWRSRSRGHRVHTLAKGLLPILEGDIVVPVAAAEPSQEEAPAESQVAGREIVRFDHQGRSLRCGRLRASSRFRASTLGLQICRDRERR
jgi:hypothetical protein